MPILHLPADHTDADLVLGAGIAELLGSEELHVTWTPSTGYAAPAVQALVREPAPSWAGAVGLAVRIVAELWVAFTARRSAGTPETPAAPRQVPAPRSHPAAGEPAA
jgi:hypothetical protein